MMYVIVTDLDGTILDHETYSFEAARPALEAIRTAGIPLVPCTSKTRAETEFWRARIGVSDPFIVENGGAIFIPCGGHLSLPPSAVRSGAYGVIEFGRRYHELVETLRAAAAESGCRVRGFADMSVEEVAAACAMSEEHAVLAKQRGYDEPFMIQDPNRAEMLLAAIEARGFRWTRGGRFHHILGGNDKAIAVATLAAAYRRLDPCVRLIGLGDGPNDVTFLRTVDMPILIRSARVDQLREAVPGAQVTAHAGPRGWCEAVLEAIQE